MENTTNFEFLEIGPVIDKVRLIRNMKDLEKDTIWVGTQSEIAALLGSGKDLKGVLLFCAYEDENAIDSLRSKVKDKGASAEFFKTDLATLYDILSTRMLRHMEWKLRFSEATSRNFSMRDVVTECASIASGSAFFIDKNFHVAYFGGSSVLGSRLAKNLVTDDKLASEKFRDLLENTSGNNITMRQLTNGDYSWSMNVSLDDTEPFYIVLLTADDSIRTDIALLFEMLRESFNSINFRRKHGDIPIGDFKAFMKATIEGRLRTWDEMDAYTKRLPSPPKRFITMASVTMNPSMRRVSQENLLSKLVTHFPGCSCTTLDDKMIIMLSDETRIHQPRPMFDAAAVEALLTEYDGYIAFSNATQRLDMLRTNYMLAESTLRLGRSLKENNSRIFYYEDYAEYISIELTLERFKNVMGHDDLVFLTSPDAVRIYRYDQQNGTDLLLVLYNFCKNNGNISAAAKDSFMHRNTFAARLTEIRGILKDVDLNDGKVQHRLLFSCKVFRYYNFYYDKKASQSLTERLSLTGREGS